MGVENPSLRDVAKQANVSIGTVSNVLNRPSQVSGETRKRVRDAIDMLGFIPSSAMKSGNTNSSVIGVILPQSNNPFYEELTQGLEDAIGDAGLCALIGYSREDSAIELQLLTNMIDAGFKGIIVAPVGARNQIFDKFLDKNVRVGYISQTDEEPDQCSVAVDQVSGGYIGIKYLAGLGHKRILWAAGPECHHQSNQRFVGITQAAAEFGVELTKITSPQLDFLAGEHLAPQILAMGPLPDAIFAANDTLAMGIINHFKMNGISIPGEVSILGFDNTSYAESGVVPLSSVSQTPYQLGITMGEQMLSELSAGDDHLHQHVIIRPQIVERASTQRRG